MKKSAKILEIRFYQELALHCSTANIGSLPHFQSCLVSCHPTYNLAPKGLDFSDVAVAESKGQN